MMVSPGPPGGWDFSLDDHIGDEVLSRFHSPVHFSRFFSRRPFIQVVDFPRSSFRLCSSSTALALRACIGGSPGDLHVNHLSGRCYSFLLCSKKVGLWVYTLQSFSCKDYEAQFFLWRDSDPNWRKEYEIWSTDLEAEWTIVQRKKKKMS